jgi:nucleoside-diphosphate-sugar epimerase
MQEIALIGYTGFVGGNLVKQNSFKYLYNSKNIKDIAGKEFQLVVCAAAPSTKRLANKEPEKDIESIRSLLINLEKIKAGEFILISTIDVYPVPFEVDEDTPINSRSACPYGKHRRILEKFIEDKFSLPMIVRLPGLFGTGLKKNIIYDFLNNNRLDCIHQEGVYQFYNLDYLWKDIRKARENNLRLINFATEPVSVREIAKECFGIEFINNLNSPASNYKMYTKYGYLWESKNHYIYSKSSVLKDLKNFVSSRTEKK